MTNPVPHRRTIFGLGLGLAIGAAAIMSGCTSTRHVTAWEPNGMPRYEGNIGEYHVLVYHPNAQAYWEPYSQTAYWFRDGAWWQAGGIPQELFDDTQLERRQAQLIRVKDDVPVFHHDSWVAAYPPLRDNPPRYNPMTYWLASSWEEGREPWTRALTSVPTDAQPDEGN